MTARAGRKTQFKISPILITPLLVKFLFIKIGQIPLYIVYGLSFIVRKILSFWIPIYDIRYTIPFPHLKRGKGRPRKIPFISFHLRRFKKRIRQVPKRKKVIAFACFILLTVYLYTNLLVNLAYQLPSPETLILQPSPLSSEIYDRKGRLLYRFYEGQNRSLVKLEKLPAYLVQATIAAEDKNFYSHFGFDSLAILRAMYHNFTKGANEGASTITQQLIKNSLLTPEKTVSRKVKELILAFWTERIFSKDQILEMYFNKTPYGGTAWGIEAASQTFFGKEAKDLSLAQASFLAGLPASPTQFSPFGVNPELGKLRQTWVLDRMVKNGFITQKQADDALASELSLRPQSNNILAPHFVFYVRDLLSRSLGARVISQGGLKVTTTLDLDIQQKTEQVIAEEIQNLAPLNVKNAASMVTDPRTGQILAMVGSRDYHYPGFGNYNATLALRQPGSSIKVITYATAFKQGYTPGNTILDTPVNFRDEWGNSYAPVNYDGIFHGPVSIRTALGSSFNIPAVKLLATVGVDKMIQTAKDLGITTFNDPKRYGLSLTLGAGEVKMIDMMGVYGSLAQGGFLRVPTPILKVTDSYGNTLDGYEDRKTQGVSAEVAYLLTSILSDNNARTPAFGPNSLLNIKGHTVAVKTGTSDNKRDNWTFGYTPQFVVGVWVGNNDNSLMNPALTSGVTGAAPIWNKIIKFMIEKYPPTAFERPKGIIEAQIDGRKDLAVSDILPKGLTKFTPIKSGLTKNEEKLIFSDAFSSYATGSAQAANKNSSTN